MKLYNKNKITVLVIGLKISFMVLFTVKNCATQNDVGQEQLKMLFENPFVQNLQIHDPVDLIELAQYESRLEKYLKSAILKNGSSELSTELVAKTEKHIIRYDEELMQANIKDAQPDKQHQAIADNPILILNMLSRFTFNLRSIHNEIMANSSSKDPSSAENWLDILTLEKAMDRLFRIQMVYAMSATDLAGGNLFGISTGAKLNLNLIYRLGKFARTSKMYTIAVPWLELGLQKMRNSKSLYISEEFGVTEADIQNCLMETMMEHDLEWDRRSNLYFYKEKLLDSNQNPVPVTNRKAIRSLDFTKFQRLGEMYNEVNHWSLCTGRNHQTEKEKSELFCWYDSTTHLALQINPIKKEMLSITPYVVQMYDVISDELIRTIVDSNSQRLNKSKTGDVNSSVISSVKTTVGTIVTHTLPKLSKLVEMATGFSVASVSLEPFHVVSSSYGGLFPCHLDALPESNPLEHGSAGRMATMMFYVHEPILGGYTAFPQAGVAAKPIKGSALFWYNLKRNGEIDETSYHCACPVVLGHKTVATKWIRYNEQILRYPCELQNND